jgi:predicted DNA-binding antitoxin AbrB/MazE fold protein
MYTVNGRYQNGVIMPEEPVRGREGQRVLITFLEDEETEMQPPLAEVVARIEALGPDIDFYTPPTQSLAQLLASTHPETTIDAERWNREWAAVEAAMKQRDLDNDREEGRE